ncbi:MAG: peptidase [Leptospiraceae bacterium]|nr:MAG: peptidase [Leptospiraceae bacterium]
MRQRIFFIGLTIIGIIFILGIAFSDKSKEQLQFLGIYRIIGKVTQDANRSVPQLLFLKDEDEAKLKEYFKRYYAYQYTDPEQIKKQKYLEKLLKEIKPLAKRKLDYEIYLEPSIYPNAFALPGGLILVTDGLLKTVKSESELMAVIAHELGHIERYHCIDAVKFELAARKLKLDELGEIADFANRLLIKHSYNKNQEDEADEYSFELLTKTKYDPTSVARAFNSLYQFYQHEFDESKYSDPIRDYFRSHPPLDKRIDKFKSKAKQWWYLHSEKRYIGIRNLKEKIPYSEKDFGEKEYINKFQFIIE